MANRSLAVTSLGASANSRTQGCNGVLAELQRDDFKSTRTRHCERPPGQAQGQARVEAIQNVGRPTAPGLLRRFPPGS